jgi:hypothetical protein
MSSNENQLQALNLEVAACYSTTLNHSSMGSLDG